MALPANTLKIRCTALASALLLFSPAIIAQTSDCDASGGLQCRLDHILSFLYSISIVLGVLLLVIIVIAVRIYLKNRNAKKLLP